MFFPCFPVVRSISIFFHQNLPLKNAVPLCFFLSFFFVNEKNNVKILHQNCFFLSRLRKKKRKKSRSLFFLASAFFSRALSSLSRSPLFSISLSFFLSFLFFQQQTPQWPSPLAPLPSPALASPLVREKKAKKSNNDDGTVLDFFSSSRERATKKKNRRSQTNRESRGKKDLQ